MAIRQLNKDRKAGQKKGRSPRCCCCCCCSCCYYWSLGSVQMRPEAAASRNRGNHCAVQHPTCERGFHIVDETQCAP